MIPSIRSPIEYPELLMDGDHLVQFYRDDQHLAETVTNYIAPALLDGEAAIIVATEGHLLQFEKGLKDLHINTSLMRLTGQLMMFEACATLNQFMINGMPDPVKFHEVIGTTLTQMRSRFSNVRAYGEMVNILWNEGNVYGTIELEKLWGELLENKNFTLLCAYAIDTLSEEKLGVAFKEVCQCHTHVIPAEGIIEPESSNDQLRRIADLQFMASSESKKNKHLKNSALELLVPLTALRIHLRALKQPENVEDISTLVLKCEKHLELVFSIIEKLGN